MTDLMLPLGEFVAHPDRYVLIDVRDESEFSEQHIAGAIHRPLSMLAAETLRIPDDKLPVAVCGKGGGRSAEAAARLRIAGLHGALWLERGTAGWYQARQGI
ncbi:rhodanese-like domain-containing protein [Devosia sp.]|uniref:rhodanese-like domain-containing protein n=1 Tax=Devosia sp. TaxID=1871048 RepID=UPI001AC0A912|nr:rhodanese-like domain-containing protein [Devosia sp.]MBN9309235.1 rhodanese-like domain-containing protein [Devosia sp.]